MQKVDAEKEFRRTQHRVLYGIIAFTLAIELVMLGLSLTNTFLPRRVWTGLAGVGFLTLMLFPMIRWAEKQGDRAAAEDAEKAARAAERQGKPRTFK